MGEAAPRVGRKEAALGERPELCQAGAAQDGSRGDPEHRSSLDDLGDLMLLHPGIDDVVEFRRMGDPRTWAVELGPVHEVLAIDHHQEVAPLLHGQGRQPDKAVFAPLDVGLHAIGTPAASTAGERSRHRGVADEGDGEGFQCRHVDQFPPARLLDAGSRGEGAGRAVSTGDPLSEAAADGEWLAVRQPMVVQRAR